jgi:hypothetical protein
MRMPLYLGEYLQARRFTILHVRPPFDSEGERVIALKELERIGSVLNSGKIKYPLNVFCNWELQ